MCGHRQALELPPSQLNRLKQAGFLHDLGKIVLAESLLATEGPHTEEKSAQAEGTSGCRIPDCQCFAPDDGGSKVSAYPP